MDELLKKRIDRALNGLPDDKARQVLDYCEFLQSKYGDRSTRPSPLEKLADGVEDTLRVGKVPIAAIKGTREVLSTADRVVRGLAEAGKTVVDEIQGQIRDATSPGGGGEKTAAASDRPGPESAPDDKEVPPERA